MTITTKPQNLIAFVQNEIRTLELYIAQLQEERATEPLVTYYEGRRDAFKAMLPALRHIEK